MLILKKLNITDDKPLKICFSGNLKKKHWLMESILMNFTIEKNIFVCNPL